MTITTDFAAFIGIDWGDEEHAICLIEAGSQRAEKYVIEQQAEALEQWVGMRRARFGDRPVAICLEQSRGALAYAADEV